MSDQISISVPNEPHAIVAAAEFFKILSGETVKIDVEESAPAPGARRPSTTVNEVEKVFGSLPPVSDVPPPPVFNTACVAADVPSPPPSAPVGDLDAAGHPWDSRIHASSRARVADGTWRLRRNLDPAMLESVRAEQGATMPPVAADAVPPPPPPVATGEGMKFSELLKRITAKGINKDQANAAAVKLGLPSFAIVAQRADLIPAIAVELGV